MKASLGTSKFKPAHISYVPELLPDELIYSWLGRVIKVNSLGYPKDCLYQLFGNRNVIPCIDLPTSLSSLQRNLGNNSPFASLGEALEKGTLYPYHRPFLSPVRDQLIQEMMINGHGKGLKVLMGRVANRFGANPPLRFCKDCVKADTVLYGTPYWKRLHQLPGVACCLTHKIHLDTYASSNLVIDKQSFILTPYNDPEKPSDIPASSQLKFTALSRELLYAGLRSINPSIRQRIYKEAVISSGSYTRLHHVDYESLASGLKTYYEDFIGFSHQQRLLSSAKHPLCWLRTLIDRPHTASHPMCHLLLIGYLFQSVENFQGWIKSFESLDATNLIILENKKSECDQSDELLRDVTLSCRKVAKLLSCSTTTVVCKRRKLGISINERRKILSNELIQSIKLDLLSGLAIKEIACQYKVSVATINRMSAQFTELRKNYNDLDAKITAHRECWLRMKSNHPNVGATTIRKLSPATYAWLYRHDKKWLTNINLSIKQPISAKQRVDWTTRDSTLTNLLYNYIAEIKKLENRPRVSKSFMFRLLGETMVRNNLLRLPKLDKLIQTLTESQIEFQKFRIDYAIRTLNKCTKPLRQSYIQRAANIKNWTPELKEYTRQKVCSSFNLEY